MKGIIAGIHQPLTVIAHYRYAIPFEPVEGSERMETTRSVGDQG